MRLSPQQVYQICLQVGFPPQQATIMTAIAMGESGLSTDALNDRGEFSVGLFQINMNAHGNRFGSYADLRDPVNNARAAFELSNGGRNLRPWTVFTKGIYEQYMPAAQAAATGGPVAPQSDSFAAFRRVFPVHGAVLGNESHMGRPRDGGARKHNGYDIGAPDGTPIYSVTSGKITYVNQGSGNGGIALGVLDDEGNFHYYAHMNPASMSFWEQQGLKSGAAVSAGQVIGYVGSTGNAQGPHLHYSINAFNSSNPSIDPWEYLQGAATSSGDWQSGDISFSDGGFSMAGMGDGSEQWGPVAVPGGGSWIQVGSDLFVAYRLRGEGNASAVIFWKAEPGVSGDSSPIKVSKSQWSEWVATGWVDGGTTDVFRGGDPNATFDDLYERYLFDMGMYGTEAMADPGMLAVIALGFTRDMSDEEFANRIRQTDYWNGLTDKQREWNDKSDAQKNQDILAEAAALSNRWFEYVGEDLPLPGTVDELRQSNPELFMWAESIASGQRTQVQAINQWLKSVARENPESPWSRMVRNEDVAQRQFGVDVENTAGEIQDLYREWGLPITFEEAKKRAEQVMLNEQSLEDVAQGVEAQAMTLYPHKPQGVSTRQWAQPYIQMQQQVWEVAEPDFFDSALQSALTRGWSLGEFQDYLRKDPKWKATNQARTELERVGADLGRQMGFR